MKKFRVELDPSVFYALQAESVLRHVKLKDIANEAIMTFVSEESKRFVAIEPNVIKSIKPKPIKEPIDKEPASQRTKEPTSQKIPLHKNPKAQAEALKMRGEGVSNVQIGKRLGYSESTIRGFFRRSA